MAQGNKEHNFLHISKMFTNYIITLALSLGMVLRNFRFRPCLDSPPQEEEQEPLVPLPIQSIPESAASSGTYSSRLLPRSKGFNAVGFNADSMMGMPGHMTDR